MSEEKKISYKIEVTKIEEVEKAYIEKFVLEEKPAGKKMNSYGSEEVTYERKYENKDCLRTETKETEILNQIVEDLDMSAVIKAINKI